MDVILYNKIAKTGKEVDEIDGFLEAQDVEQVFFTGNTSDDYRFAINDVALKFVTSTSVWAVVANVENKGKIKIEKAGSTRFIIGTSAAIPVNNGAVIRTVDVGSVSATSYELTLNANEKYLTIIYYHNNDTTRDRETIKNSIKISNKQYSAKRLDDIESDIANTNADIENIKEKPLSTLPIYVQNALSYRPLGTLSKGYILMTFDDGAAELATYTIPTLISKEVPGTFGLFSTCSCVTTPAYLETLLNAIENYGCCVAQHGAKSFDRYDEAQLMAFFDAEAEAFDGKGIDVIYGSICPGESGHEDTSTLIQAIAGNRFGAVFSGGTHGEIEYGDYHCSGPRTNMYAMPRQSGIRLTASTLEAAVDYAYDNHLILCPFWHDEAFSNDPSNKTIFEGLIDYAKTKGLTFITMADLKNII